MVLAEDAGGRRQQQESWIAFLEKAFKMRYLGREVQIFDRRVDAAHTQENFPPQCIASGIVAGVKVSQSATSSMISLEIEFVSRVAAIKVPLGPLRTDLQNPAIVAMKEADGFVVVRTAGPPRHLNALGSRSERSGRG